MKASRLIVSLTIIALMVFGWVGYIGEIGSENELYLSYIQEARTLVGQKLYIKSMQNYVKALNLQNTAEIWEEYINTSRSAYQEGSYSWANYMSSLKSACEAQPNNLNYWEELLEEMSVKGSSSNAYSCAILAKNSGVSSEKLDVLINAIIYAYRFTGSSYKNVYTSPEGISTVYDGTYWGLILPNGSEKYSLSYYYISPANSNQQVLLVTDMWAHIVDKQGTAQAVLNGAIRSALAYGDGYLPVENEDYSWSYIRCADNEIIGKYDGASAFVNGLAAVNDNGTWIIINADFQQVVDIQFDDVKLFGNGVYVNGDTMIAAENGKYGIYNAGGVKTCDFTADDIDIYMGDLIAYKDNNDLWGYVDKNGEIVIQPKYKGAKSFSNGLAAVCNDEGLWGFITKDESLVIDYQFSNVSYFNSSRSCFVYLGEWQKIEFKNR